MIRGLIALFRYGGILPLAGTLVGLVIVVTGLKAMPVSDPFWVFFTAIGAVVTVSNAFSFARWIKARRSAASTPRVQL